MYRVALIRTVAEKTVTNVGESFRDALTLKSHVVNLMVGMDCEVRIEVLVGPDDENNWATPRGCVTIIGSGPRRA